jgi:hypothetical protein
MVKIIIEEKNIEFTTEEWNFIKKYIIEDTLFFWNQTKQEVDKFPYELFDEEIVNQVTNIRKETLNKLAQININIYNLNM